MGGFFLAVLLGAGSTPGVTGSPGKKNDPKHHIHYEPQSSLDFQVTLSEFTPSARGGIATIRVLVHPKTEMDEVVVSGRLQRGLKFIDGSSEKSWRMSVPRGTSLEFTEEVLVPRNGVFPVVLKAVSALPSGQSVQRSGGLRIWAGRQPPRPRKREGVLEFPGIRPEETAP